MKKIELLAPAGNFQIAVAALNAGANAIYCGLQNFSARKSAANITKDELLRLKSLATEKKAKIYITLNTIIQDDEIKEIFTVLQFLAFVQIDAVIVQDLGLIKLIKDNFPDLEIHASTQMGINNSAGVIAAKLLGIKRVVLARELSFSEIKKIKTENPGMEFECFIHGALCYSFSGLCLASGVLLDRSGNRGECAQICRSYYSSANKQINNKYCFSCNDLALGSDILSLQEIGIDSLKIEGRMKDSNYVTSTIEHYLAILNKSPILKIKETLTKSLVSFARKQTTGYFNNRLDQIISNDYAGHRGVAVGTIMAIKKEQLVVKLSEQIQKNDTLLFFHNDQAIKFQAFDIFNTKGSKLDQSDNGSIVSIHCPQLSTVKSQFLNSLVDQTISLIQRGKTSNAKIDYKTIKPFKRILPITITINSNELNIHYQKNSYTLKADFLSVENSNLIELLNEKLSQSGELPYIFEITKNAGNGIQNFSLPQSKIKELKNTIYQTIFPTELNPAYIKICENQLSETHDLELLQFVAKRSNVSPKHSKIPFIPNSKLHDVNYSTFTQYTFLPINPYITEYDKFTAELTQLIESSPQKHFVIGINNLAHFELFTRYHSFHNVSFFIDFFLYCGNSNSIQLLKSFSNKIKFYYSWVESSKGTPESTSITDKKLLPLFVSRACFHRNNKLADCANCNKKQSTPISNGRNTFDIITDDCITYMFLKN